MAADAKIRELSMYRVPEDEDLHAEVLYTTLAEPSVKLTATAVVTGLDLDDTLGALGEAAGQEFAD